jgi:hypothetical protein
VRVVWCRMSCEFNPDRCFLNWRQVRYWCAYCREELGLLPQVPQPPPKPPKRPLEELPPFMRTRPQVTGWRRAAALKDARELANSRRSSSSSSSTRSSSRTGRLKFTDGQ